MKPPALRILRRVLAANLFWFAAVSLAAGQQLTFTPFHANGIYARGQRAGWRIAAASGAPAGVYLYTIKTNNRDVVKRGSFDLAAGRATLALTLDQPAMLYVTVTRQAAGAPHPDPVATLGAAVDPAGLRPSVPRPADFDSFWRGKLRALSQVPIDPKLTPVASAQPGVKLFQVTLASLGSHVHGYLATPDKPGKFPALVIYQYAGVYALNPATAASRAAQGWLAFDVDSHDLPPDQATGVPGNYPTIGANDREKSYFLAMYLRDTRALDYIQSRPDWDGKTIVLLGTSMGGQQSLVTAGLNPRRVSAVIVNEPSGADADASLHGRQEGYPFWAANDPQVMRTALYFDPVNFASRIRAPALVAMGFIDTIAPPAGIWTAFNQIPGAKEAVPMIDSDHNNRTPEKQGAFRQRSAAALATLLHGGRFRPRAHSAAPAPAAR